MANREELAIIRGARSGRADAQLELGKRYLFGSAGLPRSLPTALHWLDRAARQDCAESCELIGSHIPLDLARLHPTPLAPWYERAYDGGNVRAGLVLAQLVLDDGRTAPEALQAKALHALEEAARAGFAEAQWLLARRPEIAARIASASAVAVVSPSAAAQRNSAAVTERAGQAPERRAVARTAGTGRTRRRRPANPGCGAPPTTAWPKRNSRCSTSAGRPRPGTITSPVRYRWRVPSSKAAAASISSAWRRAKSHSCRARRAC